MAGCAGRVGTGSSLSHYLPTPHSPLRPPRGPVLYEMGCAPAIPLLLHRERNCVASRLRARVEIQNGSGFQEITLSCRLQATPHAIGAPRACRRCRQCRRRGSKYPLPEPRRPEHPPAPSPTPTRAKSPTALYKQAESEQPLPKSLPLATASQTD
jgi:hypothetical protein